MMLSHGKGKSVVQFHVNGETREAIIRSGDTLLQTLRGQLGLSGAKPACGNGDCGACTILMGGKPVHSCLVLSIEALNKSLLTIEGLKDSPIQKAFVEKWAIQCGYCTPGFVLNCHALLQAHPDASDETIEEWLESNLCRCTGYAEIKEAVKSVLDAEKKNPRLM
ncbi:(2Fe-2S)-binding protein [Siminovitchia fortis]|uniref:(2Fe-2S)-binding protein n=1 Tax=Siminovitchia fortis TaxID=254758 RepID=UPI0011A2CAFB|nr:(2Fe-2S)-binding protein [Siminovitchia fortis]